MNGFMSEIAALLLAFAIYIVLPATVIWGWVRWATHGKQWIFFPIVSLIGFVFATMSGLFAIWSIHYAHTIGGFPFYDPLLLRFYRWGALLSATGFLFAIIGVWKPSSLRWHSLVSAAGTFIFWVAAAAGE